MTQWQVLASWIGSKVIKLHSIVSTEINRLIKAKYTRPPYCTSGNKTNNQLETAVKYNMSVQY